MKKVLFVATVVKTHIMEFHIPYLKMFKEEGWETAVAARNDYENPADCVIPYCDIYYNIPFERNPLKPGNLKAYKELKHIIDEGLRCLNAALIPQYRLMYISAVPLKTSF